MKRSQLVFRTALICTLPLAGISSALACPGDGTQFVGSVCYMATNFCPQGYLKADGQLLSISQNQALYALIGITYGGNGTTNFNLPDLRGRAVINWGDATAQTTAVAYGAKRGSESVTLNASQTPLQTHTHQATYSPSGTTQAQASGTVTLPVAVNVPAQNVSVSGHVRIANSTATGQQAVSGNAVLAKGGAAATIYAPSTTSADTDIGPSQTFSGNTTATTVNTSATGPVSLPVTGSSGTVTVAAANAPATAPVSLISPQQALTACIATEGIFPTRP